MKLSLKKSTVFTPKKQRAYDAARLGRKARYNDTKKETKAKMEQVEIENYMDALSSTGKAQVFKKAGGKSVPVLKVYFARVRAQLKAFNEGM